MGVIPKTTERNIHIKPAASEETLYIPSSEDDRSEVSVPVRTRHAQLRILPRNRPPLIGGSAPALKPQSGRKKSRRYQNVNQLVTLVEEDEIHDVTIEDFVESSRTPFSILLEDGTSLQKWEAFVSSSEESQRQVVQTKREPSYSRPKTKLNPSLRSLVKKRNLPLGMVQFLENELVEFFTKMPLETYVSPQLDSFQRLLLHGVSDYHSLVSLSFDKQPDRIRLVRVENPRQEFSSSPVLLADYLASLLPS